METLVELRKESRTELSWPVSVWLPEANRFFNGRSSNISKNGVYLVVPITTPVRKDQVVELNFPRTESLAKEKGSFARIKGGRVVRVDRQEMVQYGRIGVAVEFD